MPGDLPGERAMHGMITQLLYVLKFPGKCTEREGKCRAQGDKLSPPRPQQLEEMRGPEDHNFNINCSSEEEAGKTDKLVNPFFFRPKMTVLNWIKVWSLENYIGH